MSQWIEVLKEEDLHKAKVIIHNSARIALFRLHDGIFAIDDTCSHAEYSLAEGDVQDHKVECPGHGAIFDIRNGENLSFPAVTPVHSYPVRVENGKIFIKVANE